MFGLIKKLFSGIFTFIGKVLGFGGKTEQLPAAKPDVEPAPTPAAQPQTFFLEPEEARGYQSSNGRTASATPAATAASLNLPEPKVTQTANSSGDPAYAQFARRRPGANMNAFLEMAKQVKTSS